MIDEKPRRLRYYPQSFPGIPWKGCGSALASTILPSLASNDGVETNLWPAFQDKAVVAAVDVMTLIRVTLLSKLHLTQQQQSELSTRHSPRFPPQTFALVPALCPESLVHVLRDEFGLHIDYYDVDLHSYDFPLTALQCAATAVASRLAARDPAEGHAPQLSVVLLIEPPGLSGRQYSEFSMLSLSTWARMEGAFVIADGAECAALRGLLSHQSFLRFCPDLAIARVGNGFCQPTDSFGVIGVFEDSGLAKNVREKMQLLCPRPHSETRLRMLRHVFWKSAGDGLSLALLEKVHTLRKACYLPNTHSHRVDAMAWSRPSPHLSVPQDAALRPNAADRKFLNYALEEVCPDRLRAALASLMDIAARLPPYVQVASIPSDVAKRPEGCHLVCRGTCIVLVNDPDQLSKALQRAGIDATPLKYSLSAVLNTTSIQDFPRRFPASYLLHQNGVLLPCHESIGRSGRTAIAEVFSSLPTRDTESPDPLFHQKRSGRHLYSGGSLQLLQRITEFSDPFPLLLTLLLGPSTLILSRL